MRKTLLGVVISAVSLVVAGQVLAAQRGHGGGRQAGGHGARAPGAGHYHGYAGGYRGWYGGYWGPRVGFYYGGPGYWGAGWPTGWGYGYPYAGAYAYSPLVVNAAPQEYIQQEPAPTVPPQDAAATSYWYYCTEPAGYFPYVRNCSQPWMKVIPQAPGEESSAPRLAP